MPTYYDQLVEIMREHRCVRVPGGKGSHQKQPSEMEEPDQRPHCHRAAFEEPSHR